MHLIHLANYLSREINVALADKYLGINERSLRIGCKDVRLLDKTCLFTRKECYVKEGKTH